MNTRDTGPKAKNKAQTGDTRLLNGYKVGMRDPNGYGARLAAKVWHVAPDGRWGCRPCPACAASPPSEVASFAPSGAGIGGGLKRTTKRI